MYMTASNERPDLHAHNHSGGPAQTLAQAPRQDPVQPSKEAAQGTRKSEVVILGLQKAMEGLVKAQDHLNSAGDQASDDIARTIAGIIQKVRGLQREVSNLMHTASGGK
jgi:hypothetical protein